ncbi:MAG TPA: 50S ribosomal protein L23 [Anaerolineae bacterium]|nr:50S ribosomal protein L23 [Anaerolineae bacterium]HMR62438.1 50S ribosomal protein L23 [Anaerolineae bacterium]
MGKNPYEVIIRPVITEKSNVASAYGQYTFVVDQQANKVEIAEAVSYIFDVDVVKVRVINQAPKFGRWGRKRVQRKSAYKKAVVSVPPGQRIEAFEGV